MNKIYNFFLSNFLVSSYFLNPNNRHNNNAKIEIIIFSYNRALQLESLLKSLIDNLDGNIKIHVLYKTENDTNSLYDKVKKVFYKYKNINFIYQQNSFKKSLCKLIKSFDQNNSLNIQLLFFVDDQILFRKVKLKLIKRLFELAPIITLRIGLNTRKSFNLNKEQNLKDYSYFVKKDLLVWRPLFINDDISYIFSLDGSSIPFKLFKRFSRYLIYKGPNTLESAMNYGGLSFKILRLKIASFIKQSVINLVITKVQKETNNRGDFIPTKELDDLFINNWKLKINPKKIDKFDSPHSDNGYIFEKENI